MVVLKFTTFSIVHTKDNKGVAIMALSERPDVFLTELQQAKTGIDLDVRYQQLMTIASTFDTATLQVVISKLNSLLTANQGS